MRTQFRYRLHTWVSESELRHQSLRHRTQKQRTHLYKPRCKTSFEFSASKSPSFPLFLNYTHPLTFGSRNDSTPSLLKYPLPASNPEAPDTKKARLTKGESASDTIEDRILGGTYTSFKTLKDDVNRVRAAITGTLSTAVQNGKTRSSTPSEPAGEVQEQLSKLVNVLSTFDDELSNHAQAGDDDMPTAAIDQPPRQQIITLRSQVNGGSQMLFSNLQEHRRTEIDGAGPTAESEGSGMPNGFELTDFTGLGGNGPASKPEKRFFSSVFRQSGRIKPLDLPQPAKDVSRETTLKFIPNSKRSQNPPQNKHNYKHAKLPVGSWLSYGSGDAGHGRKPVRHASIINDLEAAVAANDVQQGSEAKLDPLFLSAYSSFAPSTDNSYSLIPEKERSRHWWHKFGNQTMSKFFISQSQEEERDEDTTDTGKDKDEFADLVANFEPVDSEGIPKPDNGEKETDELLEEVSDMIETLSSYQKNRGLETIAAGTVPKPTNTEVDVFEMLKTQLSILVSALPPYAVAKLNGDQLEELNISTKLLVEMPDYPGTGLPDEYTLRRQKITQQASAAASRTTTAPPVRPNYPQTSGTPLAYNSQVRNYNASVPATAAYGMRAPQNYQTPTVARPTYAQNPYQHSSTPFSSRPTVQQFQRPLQQNGYGNYSGSPGQPQTPGFGQRPTQQAYQPRAPDSSLVNAARSASPQKPLVNGQHFSPRQYGVQTPPAPFPFQRQNSGRPMSTTPGPATVSAGSGASPAPGPTGSQSPAVAQSVEVSR